MLVSEDHVVERVDVIERELHEDPPGVHMRYNHTEPSVISDGVDFIAVIDTDDDVYRLDFWGFEFGRLRVTPVGVEEIGDLLTADTHGVPKWILDPDTVDAEDRPWWIPDEVDIAPTETCGVCGDTVPARAALTPHNPPPQAGSPVVCQDCWRNR